MDKHTIGLLLYKNLQGTLSPEEAAQLEQWKQASDSNRLLVEELGSEEILAERLADFYPENKTALRNRILQSIRATALKELAPVKPLRRIGSWQKWGWAAAVVLVLGTIAFLLTTIQQPKSPNAKNHQPVPADIAPGGDKAMLTLEDGTKIRLDDAANGTLARQGNAQVTKLADGQLVYNLNGSSETRIMMNTMSTPKGGQYRLTLPDGTRVWLNAASSITYPAAFAEKQRKVSITGEAYFEVAKNQQQPFIVAIDGIASVEVLGTAFNINSYADEATTKTTLLEGSIRISSGKNTRILHPGEQSQIAGQTFSVTDNADPEVVTAWKNGNFYFDNLDLKSILRQYSRWYDVEIVYEGAIPEKRFFGIIKRNSSLANVVKLLQADEIQYRIDNRKLVVSATKP